MVIVTTAIFILVYLFIARQSRDRMFGLTSRPPQFACVTHQISIGYISANFERIYFRFSA